MWKTWIRFNLVGIVGIGVQLGILWALVAGAHLTCLPATLLAVEATILHNFVWHQSWTWKGREPGSLLRRLLEFNLSTGLLSLVGNAVLIPLLVERLGVQMLLASLMAIAACSIANFLLADRLVFRALGGGGRHAKTPAAQAD